MSRIRLKASSRSAEAGGSRAAWCWSGAGPGVLGYTTPDMQIHWENLAALCGFDSPGRKQAAALAVSYGLAFFRRRAPCSRRVPMQDAPLSYPELSLPDIGGLPAAGTWC